jgi:serine-type D-Ala-D-Ala carboxypeptidase/endopeptidase (penicillin-binding protein 4)
MRRILMTLSLVYVTLLAFSQVRSFETFLSDTSLMNASVSFCVMDAKTEELVINYKSSTSLTPASTMKLITSATAIELLGPQYNFKTTVGYTGYLNKRTGKLDGDIVITGGGDPSLGSDYFSDHYDDFIGAWVEEIRKTGIKKIDGRVITDDSYHNYEPIPSAWLWEDAGNYYGAGVYGLSVFDNTCKIHFKTTYDSTEVLITGVYPEEYRYNFTNWLIASGKKDNGYIFAAPYSNEGWMSGTIPVNSDDFVLKGSISDPPLLIARMLNKRIETSGINISEKPTTVRIEKNNMTEELIPITSTISPPLTDIIEVLNHESVNLYAEHLIKQLGKEYGNNGSTSAGAEVIKSFLQDAGIQTDGIFIEDGSGLSPHNSITTYGLVSLLIYMKNRGKYFPEYYNSLPDAGKEGTLKYYFKDPVFDSRLRAKSGSMTRVRSYAGYFTTVSDKEMIFSIIINNYSGNSQHIISGIEAMLKEIILSN